MNKSEGNRGIDIYQSSWGMIDIPSHAVQWDIEEQCQRIKEAGFTGIFHYLSGSSQDYENCEVFLRSGLKMGLNCGPATLSDLLPIARYAKESGAVFLSAQIKDYFVPENEAKRLVEEMNEACEKIGVPFMLETHRGTITQDLLRTLELVEAVPGLGLTIDLSHYVVAGEVTGINDKIESAFDKLLKRTASIHARVSNGEQIQVDIENTEEAQIRRFKGWWRKAMHYWQKSSKENAILPFVAELGPPPYGILMNGRENPYENCDRWKQAIMLKEMAEALWSEV